MDPVREVAQLIDRELELDLGLLEDRRPLLRGAADAGGGAAQIDRKPGQALLGAVVQVALEPPALDAGGSPG